METHYYTINVEWKKDRKGEMSSPELSQNIEVATPPQFPKGVESVWSPEHLFTAAVSSCLMTEVILEPVVTIKNESEREKAERVLQKSEVNCLISNSVKSKITMIPQIKVI
ncbi:osmotically inducible protein OsmC [Elizabethkingia anophelis]|nr:osmotically inducible protein OsmC [Elizabethkingia anophelis]